MVEMRTLTMIEIADLANKSKKGCRLNTEKVFYRPEDGERI